MDVYLVPAAPDRFELYCEPADEPAPPQIEGAGVWKWLHRKFNAVLAAVEREQDGLRTSPAAQGDSAGLTSRIRTRGLRWLAGRIAEQRLLWRLRGQSTVRAFFPEGIDADGALAAIRRGLSTDADRHSRWIVLDAIGLLFSLLLTPLPGPNLPGYYFTFRVVGHFLAARGARHGLTVVSWEMQPSAPLAELAGLLRLPPSDRASRVRAIAAQLGLPRLARFYERTAGEIA